jgi:hypothetical protein
VNTLNGAGKIASLKAYWDKGCRGTIAKDAAA